MALTAIFKSKHVTSLVVQWVKIHLPMQGTHVDPQSWTIPCATEQLSLCTTITEPMCLEPMLCNQRGHCNEKLEHCKSSPCAHNRQRKPTQSNKDTVQPKLNK